MKRILWVGLLAVVLGFGMAGNAGAYLVSISDTMNITSSGQYEQWLTTGLSMANGTGTLYIEGEGDFDLSNEFLEIFVEIGSYYDTLLDSVSGTDADYYYSTFKNTWSWAKFNKTYTLSASQMASFLSDGTFGIALDLSPAVDTYWSDDYVSWTLTYDAVPEPATMFLLGAGLIGLAATRRRRVE